MFREKWKGAGISLSEWNSKVQRREETERRRRRCRKKVINMKKERDGKRL